MLKMWVRKYLQFYAEMFCLSKPMDKRMNLFLSDKYQNFIKWLVSYFGREKSLKANRKPNKVL